MPTHFLKSGARQAMIALAALSCVEIAALGSGSSWTSVAHADDDDDDDDGGGRSRSGSGGGSNGAGNSRRGPDLLDMLFGRRAEPQRPRPARRVAAVPDRVAREIVALGLNEQNLAQLSQAGFVVEDREPVLLANAELVKLRIPQRMSLDTARSAVRAEAPDATVDFNHLYRPEQADAGQCGAARCVLVRDVVGWPTAAGAACSLSPQIGLVDTAINAGHASLADADIETIRIGANDDDKSESGRQHGTAIAALLVGGPTSRPPGLLPNARVIAVDAFQRLGKSTDRAEAYDLVRALDLLAVRKVGTINLSLSGPANGLLEKTVAAVSDQGISLVAAAGNDGPNAKPVYPAAYPDVIAVTAVDRGLVPYRRAVRGEHIDIAAPGVGVWTAASISGARQKSGTSFAAPFVTAAAAILKAKHPELTPEQIADEIKRTADDLGQPGKDPIYGWGLLNARALCVTPISNTGASAP